MSVQHKAGGDERDLAARGGPARRTARRALVLLACSLALTLLLGELAVRFFVLPDRRLAWRPLPPFGGLITEKQRTWLEVSERELATGVEYPGILRFDPRLGWAPRPSSVSPDGSVHIDARGLRGTRAYGAGPSAGTVRVAACGESFTFCDEVGDADAWPAQLENLVPGLEAWNYGVGGFGTDQALLRLREAAATDSPAPLAALFVGIMLDNIGRNVNRYRPLWYAEALPAVKPRYVLRGDGLELVPQPFATRAEFVAAVRSGAVFARLAEHELWSDPHVPRWLAWSAAARLVGSVRAWEARGLERLWTDVEGEPFRTTLALLEAFRPLARELGTERLLVLVFPTREALDGLLAGGEPYWSALLEALAARDIAALDLSEPLARAARGEGIDALLMKSHLSPRGNRIVAEAVAAWLRAGAAGAEPGR